MAPFFPELSNYQFFYETLFLCVSPVKIMLFTLILRNYSQNQGHSAIG